MREDLRLETEYLKLAWLRHDQDALGKYLVRDVEDPRINIQSMLTRHFIVERLFGDEFELLADYELRFGLVMNWVLSLIKQSVTNFQFNALLDSMIEGKDKAEGLQIPGYISETFKALDLPNYICDLLSSVPDELADKPIPDYLMNTFADIWAETLADKDCTPINVVEHACGSANDYRFFDAFGIARLIDYTGFDLCDKNIANAKAMFPVTNFKVGNAIEIEAEDNTFDYCFVHDLFEHLSIEAMEVAISEVCRTTRKGICIGFFNMHDGDEHIVVKKADGYHWNDLSMSRVKKLFEPCAREIDIRHIDTLLISKFNCPDTHNKGAYTFVVDL